ncbi:two pore domain potassium channel family protein [Pollutimonas harenae]|uniref:Two pore domain potassium channel family protein n=1 Tax=Pollutimonas harenae TaxID=657015 RepID=A0A853H3H4_9BURK|nr:two pore domain potassium channel family protein [Pollutimonas harenae]NYT86792.1 two pore domain potassium channel family protein [Pollutimonas harenae]TEA71438.1 two pore domain potassium channel family protein [Pollutimonas harenae]
MYESKDKPLLNSRDFTYRILSHVGLALLVVGFTLSIGVLGHLLLEPVEWHDAVLNTALILSGIGPYIVPASVMGKLFFSLYSILVGLVFVATLGLVLAPLAHRIIHKFHLDESDED